MREECFCNEVELVQKEKALVCVVILSGPKELPRFVRETLY